MHRYLLLLLLAITPPAFAAPASPPTLNARAWLLVDHDSGARLAEHQSRQRFALGHLGKLMVIYSALQALEAGEFNLDDAVIVSTRATRAPGPRMFAQANARFPARELLQGVITGRTNDAALALAEHIASDQQAFVDRMNLHAYRLGMAGTIYRDVSGGGQFKQYTTADDTALLVSRLIRDHPHYYPWFARRETRVNNIPLYNRNALLWRDKTVDGVIACQGEREGYHLVVSARRGKMRLTAIVFGAPSESASIAAGQQLLSYGFDNFETRRLYRHDVPAVRVRIWLGNQERLPVGLRRDLYLTLPRGRFERLQAKLQINGPPYAPVALGQPMGRLTIYVEDKVISEHDLLALRDIGHGGLVQRGLDRIEMWLRDIPDSTTEQSPE